MMQRVRVNEITGCWKWTGQRNNGYGHVYVDGKTVYAHRFMYELVKGSIAAGLQVDHLCDNPRCVNPDHLEVVTQMENLRRTRRIDDEKAQTLLDTGKTIRDVADYFDVSTQAVYIAIGAGRLEVAS